RRTPCRSWRGRPVGAAGVIAGAVRLAGAARPAAVRPAIGPVTVLVVVPVAVLLFGIVGLDHALHAGERITLVDGDQGHALRRAAHLADLGDASAHQHPAVGDQHDLVALLDQHRPDHAAVPLAGGDRDHALRPAAVPGVFGDGRALAEAALGGGRDRLGLGLRHQPRVPALAVFPEHAAHAARMAPHRPDVALVEAHRLAA